MPRNHCQLPNADEIHPVGILCNYCIIYYTMLYLEYELKSMFGNNFKTLEAN